MEEKSNSEMLFYTSILISPSGNPKKEAKIQNDKKNCSIIKIEYRRCTNFAVLLNENVVVTGNFKRT